MMSGTRRGATRDGGDDVVPAPVQAGDSSRVALRQPIAKPWETESIDSRRPLRERVVLVIGMHRSGTSAITRAVAALGIALGDDLMPPVAGNNDKGFWEDREFSAINDELLATSGLNWDSLVGPELESFQSPRFEALRARAARLLAERSARFGVYGFKDPRTARLLGFWLPLIAERGVKPDLVFAIRNPRSVARSLQRRDAMPALKAYQVWLSHMTSAFCDARVLAHLGGRRIAVAFERLVDQPTTQLERLALALDLDFDPRDREVATFADDFIDPNLDHGRGDAGQLVADPTATADIIEAYAVLDALAANGSQSEWDAAEETLAAIRRTQARYAPLLEFAASADREAGALRKAHADALAEIAIQQSIRADRESTIAVLSRSIEHLGKGVMAEAAAVESGLRESLARSAQSAAVELAQAREALESARRQSLADAQQIERGEREIRTANEALRMRDAEVAQLRAALVDSAQQVGVERGRFEAAIETQRIAGARLIQFEARYRRGCDEIAQLSRRLLDAESALSLLQGESSRSIAELEREVSRQRLAVASHLSMLAESERGVPQRLRKVLAKPISLIRLLLPSEWRARLDIRSIRQSGLFDIGWYLGQHADVAARGFDPIEHYVRHGAAELRDPSRRFSTRWYLQQYPDVARARANPLAHFVRSGVKEGRAPLPPSSNGVDSRQA
jgi:hypothetical protein